MKFVVTSRQTPPPYTVVTLEVSCSAGSSSAGFQPRMLEWLFEQLNRKDDPSEIITMFGLNVPSLSMGDLVEVYDEGKLIGKFRCAPVGWVKETFDPFAEEEKKGAEAAEGKADAGESSSRQLRIDEIKLHIEEFCNELFADLETGSHHRNNEAAEQFKRSYPNLMKWFDRLHELTKDL